MGLFTTPKTLDDIILEHVASMRSYADTLDDGIWPLESRARVVARVRKCAGELERARDLVKLAEARKGQSPNGGDAVAAPALLTGPVSEGDAPQ